MTYPRPFQPIPGGTICIANATSASAIAALPESCQVVGLYNSSSTAIAYWRCQPNDSAAQASVPTVGTNGDEPIAPGEHIRLSVPFGPKKFSVIASAADGNLYITPGIGN